jgi:trehalose/maltose hydrolase-like predicted phosphorylase
MARSMVSFRFYTLKAAQDNARKNNYKGAMYPWESDEIGEETTPFFAYQNALRENHIVGDVALAQWQYFLATKDTNYLREKGAKVIFSTADFWTSRVNYNKEKDRYEIGKLVSVSESMKDVNNETYTNTVAKINLEIAQRVSDILKTNKNSDWEKISKKMFIPFDEKNQYHPTYENALPGTKESTEFWTSVAPLLSFPLQLPMSRTAKRNDFLNAVRGLEEVGAGANMGINFLPIIAAELGNDSLFNFTLEKTYKGFLRPPFNVLAETHTNHSVNFITGAGAFLQQVIFGYTGLRLTEDGLTKNFEPMLPKNIKSMRLINFSFKNMKYNISVEGKNIKIEPLR